MGFFEEDEPELVPVVQTRALEKRRATAPPVLGKFTEWVLLGCYRRTGKWPETFDILFHENVHAGLQKRADELRLAFDEDAEAEKWLAEETARIMGPRTPVTQGRSS